MKNQIVRRFLVSVSLATVISTAPAPAGFMADLPFFCDAVTEAGLIETVYAASDNYFPKYKGNSGSIVDILESYGSDSSYAYREKIAKANGIKNYKGSAEQNTQMVKLAKSGSLKKPGGSSKGSNSKDTNSKENNKNKQNLSQALYKSDNARITCGFDGYKNTSGRHEGIDFSLSLDAPVYSLTSGEITNIVRGKNGGKLSTLAVYDKDANKTVVYLHMNISGDLEIGDTVKVGQKIGTQGYRGISSKSSSHTHVEVRSGKKTLAAVSVGDSSLDNSDPSSYWKSKGYNVK